MHFFMMDHFVSTFYWVIVTLACPASPLQPIFIPAFFGSFLTRLDILE